MHLMAVPASFLIQAVQRSRLIQGALSRQTPQNSADTPRAHCLCAFSLVLASVRNYGMNDFAGYFARSKHV
jgi:hypothetical protein